MIFIGICDDEAPHRQCLREYCEQFFRQTAQKYRIMEFASGEEVLALEGVKLHLLFLDVEMSGLSGIEVMRRLENTGSVWRVVFVSGHREWVFDSFGVRTLSFEVKPVKYERVARLIETAIRENCANVVYECNTGRDKVYKPLDKIYYLEAEGNYTYLVEREEKTLTLDRLKVWQSRMENTTMVRIHKSYLINMDYIQRWEAKKIYMCNGAELVLGRQYKKSAEETYQTYIHKHTLGRI